MKLLRLADCRVMPWKNGGGTTAEVAIWPPGAAIEGAFGWRISMAEVGVSGAFSRFPGYDRHLLVIEGQGITLSGLPDGPVELSHFGPPASFSGDLAIDGRLRGGPIRDYNLIIRRDDYSGRLRLSHPHGPVHLAAGDGWSVATLLAGSAMAGETAVDAGDSFILAAGETAVLLPRGSAGFSLAIAEITPRRPAG